MCYFVVYFRGTWHIVNITATTHKQGVLSIIGFFIPLMLPDLWKLGKLLMPTFLHPDYGVFCLHCNTFDCCTSLNELGETTRMVAGGYTTYTVRSDNQWRLRHRAKCRVQESWQTAWTQRMARQMTGIRLHSDKMIAGIQRIIYCLLEVICRTPLKHIFDSNGVRFLPDFCNILLFPLFHAITCITYRVFRYKFEHSFRQDGID